MSEGVPIEERADQANESYGFGAMRSRPPQAAHHQENTHAVLDYFRRQHAYRDMEPMGGACGQAGTVSVAGGVSKTSLEELDWGRQLH